MMMKSVFWWRKPESSTRKLIGDLQLRALKAMKLVLSVIADSAWVETESLVKELDKEYHDDLPAPIG